MPLNKANQPPEVARFSGLYRFIPPDRFAELGIDPEDVPLGTYPAMDHPPFLPDRFGGNAYGLGLYEQGALTPSQAALIEELDLSDHQRIASSHKVLNDIFKRLGLLIRVSKQGRPFYLIPRQYVAHLLEEVQAMADEIVGFLTALLRRRLKESLKVALASVDNDLLLLELQARMPQISITVLDSIDSLTSPKGPFAAVVMPGDLSDFIRDKREKTAGGNGASRAEREAWGHFMAGRLHGMLEEDGELLILHERPITGSRDYMLVHFLNQGDFKRFLLFSHVYRTRRKYHSGQGAALPVNRFDFHSFLAGVDIYHETLEGLLGGRGLAQVEPREVDALPHQDLPLPRGQEKKILNSWQRCLAPFFHIRRQGSELPESQRRGWRERFEIEDADFPDTLVVMEGVRKRSPVTLNQIESNLTQKRLIGCERELLAGYKDTFSYVRKVLKIVDDVRRNELSGLPGLELSRLRKPFDRARRHQQLNDILKLLEMGPRLDRLENRLNPEGILGPNTPVLANLEKLALMGVDKGCLSQIYLIVVGHSTMTRVTFGKLPEASLKPLTEVKRYSDLDEAISIIRLYRLMSVAEAAAASSSGLGPGQVGELFALYDEAIRVATDPELDWPGLIDSQIAHMGGVQAKATRKMLKLFNFFEFLDNWRDLETSGPREKEAMAGYDWAKLARIEQVVKLSRQMNRFAGGYFTTYASSRPFFFRAFLNSELHGTGRLLPSLGTEAGFILLWICIHASEKRLINFNPLLEVTHPDEMPSRLGKLASALGAFTPGDLRPEWLASLRKTLENGEEAYILDSGLYLTLDPRTRALCPKFVDPVEDLKKAEAELRETLGSSLAKASNHRLSSIDRALDEVGRFLKAQGGASPSNAPDDMASRHALLVERFVAWLLKEIFDLPGFAVGLSRAMANCPRILSQLLPTPEGSPLPSRRLASAVKLSALYTRRLDHFQDMQASHETARVEFGPTTAGIVGVSPLQFQRLTASLSQLLSGPRDFGAAMMLAVLLQSRRGLHPDSSHLPSHPLIKALAPGRQVIQDLEFLLRNQGKFRQIISGEACLTCMNKVLGQDDPPLLEALFLVSAIFAAASREGLLTEDLLEASFAILGVLRDVIRHGGTLEEARQKELLDQARKYQAFQHYLDAQRGEAPAMSLRHLLETTDLNPEENERDLARGALQAGLNRLLRLRGLIFLSWLDVMLLREQVPARFIYRQKGMRSIGPTHFERSLYEGLRLYRAFEGLAPDYRRFLLNALEGGDQQLIIMGFARAAENLTSANSIRLLLLGLAAALRLQPARRRPKVLSFLPLAWVIDRKFELVNQAVTRLKPADIMESPQRLRRSLARGSGLKTSFDPSQGVLSLDIADPVGLDRKIGAVRNCRDAGELKRIYHLELKKLKDTHYHTLDYQKRLEEAYQENLDRLGEEMTEDLRRRMSIENDLDRLSVMYGEAREAGLELPLSQERLHGLRDLYEMNSERLRRALLEELTSRLDDARDPGELEYLWSEVKRRLQELDRHLPRDFHLLVAARFDQRDRELKVRRPPSA